MASRLQHIDFYQLAGGEVSELAAQLTEKSQSVGKKTIIYAPKSEAQNVSRALWVLRDLSFLAHGIDGDDGAEFAHIWVSSDPNENQISAEFAILLFGQLVPDMTAYERCFVLFNGKDEAGLQEARSQWKSLSSQHQGLCRYFAKTDEGKWEQKAAG